MDLRVGVGVSVTSSPVSMLWMYFEISDKLTPFLCAASIDCRVNKIYERLSYSAFARRKRDKNNVEDVNEWEGACGKA